MAEVDSMMFSMNVKLKNKHTSIKRRRIFKVYSSNVQWKKNIETQNIYIYISSVNDHSLILPDECGHCWPYETEL